MRANMAPKVLAVQNQQFSRSLDRILEEAFLSGELLLTGRKLKDFPKTSAHAGQFNLEDTVFAGNFTEKTEKNLPDGDDTTLRPIAIIIKTHEEEEEQQRTMG